MIGSIIGAVGGIVGSVIGGANSSAARKRQQSILYRRAEEQKNSFDRDFYKDYIQGVQGQSAINKARQIYSYGVTRADANKAVIGGTDESIAAAKERANKAVSDAVIDVAINGERAQAHANDVYQAQADKSSTASAQIEASKAEQNAKSATASLQAGVILAHEDANQGGNLVGNMFGFNERKKK